MPLSKTAKAERSLRTEEGDSTPLDVFVSAAREVQITGRVVGTVVPALGVEPGQLHFEAPWAVQSYATTTDLEEIVHRLDTLEARIEQVHLVAERPESTGHLNTLLDSRFILKRPIAIAIGQDEDVVVARWAEALLEGEGDSEPEALQHLREQIVAAYFDLSESLRDGKKLAGYPESLWKLLTDLIHDAAAENRRAS